MWIARLRVSGGFLDGLDLSFSEGLNVIIGGRGSGKTSILELLRHSMNLAHANVAQERESREFIRGVLGSGDVTVDLVDDGEQIRLVVDSVGSGWRNEVRNSAIMVGQNELEAIASDPPSRLNLLDIRAGIDSDLEVPSAISRLTRRLWEIREASAQLREDIQLKAGFVAELANARSRESALLSTSGAQVDTQRDELRALEELVLRTRRSRTQLGDYSTQVLDISESVDALGEEVASVRAATVPANFAGAAQIFVESVDSSLAALRESVSAVGAALATQVEASVVEEQSALEASAPLKEAMSEAEEGLGQLASEIRLLNSQIESLSSKEEELNNFDKEYLRISSQRDELVQTLETDAEKLFEGRLAVAKLVTGQLENKAAIQVEHFANTERLRTLLTEALKGSGLQYKSIVDRLVGGYLPRGLLEVVESNDVSALGEAISLQADRAARVVQALDTPDGLAQLAEMVLEDQADYLLRHGSDLKNVEQLSTGQKCAVTLPILMTEMSRALLLDQPEDHLDNAFLVDAVLPGLDRRRESDVQTIVATHNANIPVLGGANQVIAMESDGRRGYISAAGDLDDPAVVGKITTIMEGGRKAFQQRAAFYQKHERP